MSKKKQSQITDYNSLREVIKSHIFLFCKGELRVHILNFIMDTSMTSNRIYVDLYPHEFIEGFPNDLICGLPWKIREIRKARRALKDSGLIFYDYLPQNSTKTVRYIVNVVGILNILKRVISKEQFPDKLYKKAIIDMKELGYGFDWHLAASEEDKVTLIEKVKRNVSFIP